MEDSRVRNGVLCPVISPEVRIIPGQRIFTIGSCFARNIEKILDGYDVPTRTYSTIEGDPLAPRGNTVLNEYNPGTMAHRITVALEGRDPDRGIVQDGDDFSDYLITGQVSSSRDLVVKRRQNIDSVYKQLPGSDLLVITLGMTECWFDKETDLYLNRAPGAFAFRDPEKNSRFEFRILNVDDCVEVLLPSLSKLMGVIGKVILTVSPVPLQRTFGTVDAVIANATSKATLRCAAIELVESLPQVDYFPSYEMVTTYIGNPFQSDNVHILPEVVEYVTQYMLACYEGRR